MREARKVLKIWFCLDTLEYLRRGGRIGKAQAWLGGTLKIKPILSLEYEIVPVERVRTAGRAFERMVEYARELADSGSDGWVVQHIQAPGQAERLIDRCREIFDSEPALHLGGRTGDRHLHRARPDRRRRGAARAAGLSRYSFRVTTTSWSPTPRSSGWVPRPGQRPRYSSGGSDSPCLA